MGDFNFDDKRNWNNNDTSPLEEVALKQALTAHKGIFYLYIYLFFCKLIKH